MSGLDRAEPESRKGRASPLQRTWHLLQVIAGHGLVAAALLGVGFGLHHLVTVFGDPMLFDEVPLRYVVDAIDFGALVSFVIYGTASFIVELKDED